MTGWERRLDSCDPDLDGDGDSDACDDDVDGGASQCDVDEVQTLVDPEATV